MPNELSGGEQQRVSLARALVNNPDLIIADEPTGNVDPEMSHEIVELLTKINNNGTTVVMVTHEHDLVRTFQRRVIVIQKGKVVSDTPDPTFAKFKTKETKKENDMFYYEQDVKNENLTEVFEDLEENSTEPQSDESKKENIGSVADESSEGTVDLNELAQGGEQ